LPPREASDSGHSEAFSDAELEPEITCVADNVTRKALNALVFPLFNEHPHEKNGEKSDA
jgi:hypothetical protein